MSWLALNNIDDAITATKAFLSPFDRSRWIRLLIVVFFLSGIPGAQNLFNWPTGSGNGGTGAAGLESGAGLALLAIIVIAVIGIVLLYTLLSEIMEFVLVDSIRSDEVHLRRYLRAHWKRGVRLFGFRIGVIFLTLIVAGVLGLLLFAAINVSGSSAGVVSLLGLVVGIPLLVVLFLISALVNGFTTTFIVPTMLIEGGGVLNGWRRFWKPLRQNLKEYAVYVVVNWLLHFVAGFAVGIVTVLGAVVITIPFGVVGAVVGAIALFAAGANVSTPVIAIPVIVIGVVLGLIWLLLLFVFVLAVRVPVVSFFRYYALLILGDTDEELDLIPDQRTAVRS